MNSGYSILTLSLIVLPILTLICIIMLAYMYYYKNQQISERLNSNFISLFALIVLGVVFLLLDSIAPYIFSSQNYEFISEPYSLDKENSALISVDFRVTDDDDPQQRVFSRVYDIRISNPTIEKNAGCFVVAMNDIKHTSITIRDENEIRVADSEPEENSDGFPSFQLLKFDYANFMDIYCPDQQVRELFGPYFVHKKSNAVDGVSRYFYPFDTMKIDAIVWLSPIKKDSTTPEVLKIIPSMNITVISDPKWHFDVSVNEINDNVDKGKKIQITFRRQWLYIILYPAILFFLFILIVFLPAIKNIDTYLSALVGLLFGIWGMKQVLLPNYVTWATVLDPIITGYYLLIIFGAFLRFTLGGRLYIFPVVKNSRFSKRQTSLRRVNKKRR